MVKQMSNTKPIDIVAVKSACKNGILTAYTADGKIYLKDNVSEECVCIGDVAEVKHGKWSATGLCSNCHKPYQGGYFSYYCPNCGAIMDEQN